jgi:hypothetical protein
MTIQHIIFCADRSGSMMGKEQDTVGGINTAIKTLKESKTQDDIIMISLTLFDHEQIIVWDTLNIEAIQEMNENEFIPRGQTALLDTMGKTLTTILNKKQQDVNVFDTCIIYIITDGLENFSKEYNKQKIKELIEKAEKDANITVMYMGANQDAILEATNLGIRPERAINYSERTENVTAVYRSAANSAVRSRSGLPTEFIQAERSASVINYQNVTPPPVSRPRRLSYNVTNDLSTVPEWKQHLFLDLAKTYQWETVKELINENNSIINTTISNRWSALHQAAHSGNEEIIKFLLENGASKTLINSDGNTPQDIASNNMCIQLLV